MTAIVEFARRNVIFEVDTAGETLEAVGATYDRMLTTPVNLGAIGRELRGELVGRAEGAARYSIGQTPDECLGSSLLVNPALGFMHNLERVRIPATDQVPVSGLTLDWSLSDSDRLVIGTLYEVIEYLRYVGPGSIDPSHRHVDQAAPSVVMARTTTRRAPPSKCCSVSAA